MSSRRPVEASCGCDRRRLLCGVAFAVPVLLACPGPAWTDSGEERRLVLINTHTGEILDTVYYRGGHYESAELGRLDWLLRDHRTNAVLPIAAGLFDLLHELAGAAVREPRYEIISGYRSPATNAMLAATTDGVSSKSLHMAGRAIDVRLTGYPTAGLRDLALARRTGGVGYYPSSDFVHLDLGAVRSWSG
jgi:uncharacterized protein YcbK (DUF882 family)